MVTQPRGPFEKGLMLTMIMRLGRNLETLKTQRNRFSFPASELVSVGPSRVLHDPLTRPLKGTQAHDRR